MPQDPETQQTHHDSQEESTTQQLSQEQQAQQQQRQTLLPSLALQQQQQQHAEPSEELDPLQQQLLEAYRKTCLVTGAGMAGAAWHWRVRGRAAARAVFLPPRAVALPPAVVEAWRRKAELREGMRVVGRNTLFVGGVAGLYFGSEVATAVVRGSHGDWPNAAVAGAVAGGFLGARGAAAAAA